jgi:hypothetical protein
MMEVSAMLPHPNVVVVVELEESVAQVLGVQEEDMVVLEDCSPILQVMV